MAFKRTVGVFRHEDAGAVTICVLRQDDGGVSNHGGLRHGRRTAVAEWIYEASRHAGCSPRARR